MTGSCLDAGNGAFQVVECASAAGARDVFGLAGTYTSGLQDAESSGIHHFAIYGFSLVEKKYTVAQSVEDKCSHIGCCFNLQVLHFILCIVLKEDYRIFQVFLHHLVYQGALFAQSVGMVALRNQHDFRMILQAGDGFVVQSHISDEEELQWGVATA